MSNKLFLCVLLIGLTRPIISSTFQSNVGFKQNKGPDATKAAKVLINTIDTLSVNNQTIKLPDSLKTEKQHEANGQNVTMLDRVYDICLYQQKAHNITTQDCLKAITMKQLNGEEELNADQVMNGLKSFKEEVETIEKKRLEDLKSPSSEVKAGQVDGNLIKALSDSVDDLVKEKAGEILEIKAEVLVEDLDLDKSIEAAIDEQLDGGDDDVYRVEADLVTEGSEMNDKGATMSTEATYNVQKQIEPELEEKGMKKLSGLIEKDTEKILKKLSDQKNSIKEAIHDKVELEKSLILEDMKQELELQEKNGTSTDYETSEIQKQEKKDLDQVADVETTADLYKQTDSNETVKEQIMEKVEKEYKEKLDEKMKVEADLMFKVEGYVDNLPDKQKEIVLEDLNDDEEASEPTVTSKQLEREVSEPTVTSKQLEKDLMEKIPEVVQKEAENKMDELIDKDIGNVGEISKEIQEQVEKTADNIENLAKVEDPAWKSNTGQIQVNMIREGFESLKGLEISQEKKLEKNVVSAADGELKELVLEDVIMDKIDIDMKIADENSDTQKVVKYEDELDKQVDQKVKSGIDSLLNSHELKEEFNRKVEVEYKKRLQEALQKKILATKIPEEQPLKFDENDEYQMLL